MPPCVATTGLSSGRKCEEQNRTGQIWATCCPEGPASLPYGGPASTPSSSYSISMSSLHSNHAQSQCPVCALIAFDLNVLCRPHKQQLQHLWRCQHMRTQVSGRADILVARVQLVVATWACTSDKWQQEHDLGLPVASWSVYSLSSRLQQDSCT